MAYDNTGKGALWKKERGPFAKGYITTDRDVAKGERIPVVMWPKTRDPSKTYQEGREPPDFDLNVDRYDERQGRSEADLDKYARPTGQTSSKHAARQAPPADDFPFDDAIP